MRNRSHLACLLLSALLVAAGAIADDQPVSAAMSTATTPAGEYISWREHIIDDSEIGLEPNLSGSDGFGMADLDGDGFEDIVSVHEADVVYSDDPSGLVRIAWGGSDPHNWKLTTLATGAEVAGAEDVAIADADGDGYPDIVVAAELAHLIYFMNPGTDARTVRWERTIPPIASGRGSFIRVFFADLDGDGRPEVLAANKGDQNAGVDGREVVTARNVSAFVLPAEPLEGDLWREQVLAKGLVPINSEPVDIDGDGDLDVVAGFRTESRIAWLENLGDMRFQHHAIEVSGNDPGIQGFNMDYADIDGDGRLDIVETTPRLGPLIWLKQPDSVDSPWEIFELGEAAPDLISSVTLADVDGDGDLDMVGTRGNSYPFDGVIWLEQVRTRDPQAVFSGARKVDSAEMPAAPANYELPSSMRPEDHLPIRRDE